MRYLVALLPLVLIAGCGEQPPPPAVAPAPPQKPVPPPPLPSAADWRDMPLTPGTWRYQPDPTGSAALFADGVAVLRCNRAGRQVTLSGNGLDFPMRVITSTGAFSIPGPLGARDPILDNMAFSRGRFVVTAANGTQRVLPSWPEVARVIEDCRS